MAQHNLDAIFWRYSLLPSLTITTPSGPYPLGVSANSDQHLVLLCSPLLPGYLVQARRLLQHPSDVAAKGLSGSPGLIKLSSKVSAWWITLLIQIVFAHAHTWIIIWMPMVKVKVLVIRSWSSSNLFSHNIYCSRVDSLSHAPFDEGSHSKEARQLSSPTVSLSRIFSN